MDPEDLASAARVAVERAAARGWTVATAESLTGGLLGSALTSVPGSSQIYVGGVISYATEVKISLLSVPREVIDTDGVVSQACAEAMARGVRGLIGADCGVSTTGVAGPGPQDGVPAGTVWVAVAGSEHSWSRQLSLTGSREENRGEAVRAALEGVGRVASGVDA